ncbi:MAG: PspC domain-containing protein [Acidimicrobiia bacterium]
MITEQPDESAAAREPGPAPEPAPEATPLQWIRSRLHRSRKDRVVSGVAGGLAATIGIPAVYVRAALVSLTFTGGVGIAVYVVVWALTLDRARDAAMTPLEDRKRLALALMFGGALLALRGTGLWFGDGLVWSVTLVSFGIAVVWDKREASAAVTPDVLSSSRMRLVAGGFTMLAGLWLLFAQVDLLAGMGPVVLAVTVTALGFMLVFGNWVRTLAADLATERRDRIRTDERSELAAHLHDSVLQTLALIQRSDDAKRMVTLARAQERELRTWLYGGGDPADGDRFAGALEAAAARVEQAHDVPVEVVTVGDAPLDDDLRALLAAAAEAMTNAAKHSGAPKVSVYGELHGWQVEIWVSDQGSGFDLAAVPPDRRGIIDSIRHRVERHDGTVEIVTEPGAGTEVHLAMDRVP